MDLSIRSERSLGFLIFGDEIALGLKKRGFGAGYWNGFGGKLENGETVEGCLIREGKDEFGIIIEPGSIRNAGVINFFFLTKPEWNQRVHIFTVIEWRGILQESDEMKPQWFKIKDIPYAKMWPDDIQWLPKILRGEIIRANVFFKDALGNVEKIEFT
ncbi:MAG: 8-oxo-dGTP diphosphatase [Candidatus Jorgensenbacteria bacterium]|nr:8-oxo-dGTP diphosphatase [Candidatus Jorgensenbacteria bacterium]